MNSKRDNSQLIESSNLGIDKRDNKYTATSIPNIIRNF